MSHGAEVLGRVKASFAVAHRFAALTRPPRFAPRHLWNASRTYRLQVAPLCTPQRAPITSCNVLKGHSWEQLRTQIDGGFSGFMESASRRDRHCL